MRCPDCGHNNAEDDRFCGICGEPLPVSQGPESKYRGNAEVAAVAAPPVSLRAVAIERVQKDSGAAVDRPIRVEQEFTFGLPAAQRKESKPPANGDGYQYPFDDEVRTSRFAKYVSLLALLILGALIAKEWRPLRQQVRDALRITSRATQPPVTPVAAPAPASQATDSQAADGAAQSGEPQAGLPASPTPGEARAASHKPARSQREKAFKRQSGQPRPGKASSYKSSLASARR